MGQYLAGDRPHGNVAKGGGSDTKRKLFDVIEVHNIECEGEGIRGKTRHRKVKRERLNLKWKMKNTEQWI